MLYVQVGKNKKTAINNNNNNSNNPQVILRSEVNNKYIYIKKATY